MAGHTAHSGGGASAGFAFVLGGLVVGAAVIAWFVFARGMEPTRKVDLEVDLPKIEAPRLPDAPTPQTR